VQLLADHAKAVLILSHRGRPTKRDTKFSLRKDARHLAALLGRKVDFLETISEAKKAVRKVANTNIFVLENLRFYRGEEKNDHAFAKKLAALGDYYVNDAFPVSHRPNASISAITKFLPAYGGLSLREEIKNLSHILRRPRRPLVMIFGGAKISDKLQVFRRFKNRADCFLVGGALANTLLLMKGEDVGLSLVEKNSQAAYEILMFKNLLLPSDFRWNGRQINDIGPKTVALFSREIAKARTIIWNGPMGVYEKPAFSKGTLGIAKAIARNKHAFKLVGGGETVTALKLFGLDRKMSFLSTGGGAMLEFLSGKKLPGIVALEKSRKTRCD
jgi:3-phosphoglycerate kinase